MHAYVYICIVYMHAYVYIYIYIYVYTHTLQICDMTYWGKNMPQVVTSLES